jgi:hypothetical protein
MKKTLSVFVLCLAVSVLALPLRTRFNGTTGIVIANATNILNVPLNVGENHNIAVALGFLYAGSNASTQIAVWQSTMDGVNWVTYDTWTMVIVSNPLPVFFGPTNYTNLLPGVWQLRLHTWALTNAALNCTNTTANISTNLGTITTNITTNVYVFPYNTNILIEGNTTP